MKVLELENQTNLVLSSIDNRIWGVFKTDPADYQELIKNLKVEYLHRKARDAKLQKVFVR